MRKMARVLLAAAALALGLAMVVHAEGGVIRGQVTHGTAGDHPSLGGLAVRLYLFSGNTLKETRWAHTDPQGVYRFDGLPTGGAWSAVATVQHAGVEYDSQTLDLVAGGELAGDITIYETTTDDSALRVDRSHLIIEAGEGQLEVTEQVILANTGDRTYVGREEIIPNRKATARLALPAGATDVSFEPRELASDMVRTGQGFVDTRPVVPGRQDYLFSYVLPVDASSYTLSKPLAYATGELDVLVHVPGVEISAPPLERLGTREASGVTYQSLVGRNLHAGSSVQVRLSGLGREASDRPEGGQSSMPVADGPRQSWWHRFGPLLLLPALLVPVAIRLHRSGRVGGGWMGDDGEREALLARVADLDEHYEVGEIGEPAYRKERAEVMNMLLSLAFGPQAEESECTGGESARRNARRADARPRKEVRARSRAAQRRPKAN